MKYFLILILCLLVFSACGPNTLDDPQTGPEMIEASIRYHDPKGNWATLDATFWFEDSLPPSRNDRKYSVTINNAASEMSYAIEGQSYKVIGDSVIVLEGEVEDERALRMRNYYTYLWGLPMKLNDPGTLIDEKVGEEVLNGVTYHVVRIPYEKDIWYFYLEPKTFRMAAYKFYQDEPNLKGEIIYLEDEKVINGIRIPANRTWYRTEIPEFLATDKLVKVAGN